jgi:pimeloyl-ACP methyl ester carboxylesterase
MHAAPLASNITKATSGNAEDVLLVSYPASSDIDAIANFVIEEVEARWPSPSTDSTVEVDVVGVSMGGIVARWASLPLQQRVRSGAAASPPPRDSKRLNIVNLFTYASPHRGAELAQTLAFDAAAMDLKPGSGLLATLDNAWINRTYELTCYAHTNDAIVGATRTSPPGTNPIWTRGTLLFSHFAVVHNPIFIADTARRLRGETPLVQASEPPPRN